MQVQSRDNIISMMKAGNDVSDAELEYMLISMAPWPCYIRPDDVARLNFIATSIRYAGAVEKKLAAIKQIMEYNGFKRFAGGTNRIIFRHLEDSSIVAKVAIDRVGLKDNPAEFNSQELIRPFCAKMIQITPCGTVGFAERVQPIKTKEEFSILAPDIFDVLDNLLGKYVMDDVGTKYFLNWGVTNRGPVLLDYPYIYRLDPNKLICKNMVLGRVCGGFIDYDDGYNHLTCQRCGKKYNAVDLNNYSQSNERVKTKGGITMIPMKTKLKKGNEVIATNDSSDIIKGIGKVTNNKKEVVVKTTLKKGDTIIARSDNSPIEKVVKPKPVEEEPIVKTTLKKGDETITKNYNEEVVKESEPVVEPEVVEHETVEEPKTEEESVMKPFYVEGNSDDDNEKESNNNDEINNGTNDEPTDTGSEQPVNIVSEQEVSDSIVSSSPIKGTVIGSEDDNDYGASDSYDNYAKGKFIPEG